LPYTKQPSQTSQNSDKEIDDRKHAAIDSEQQVRKLRMRQPQNEQDEILKYGQY